MRYVQAAITGITVLILSATFALAENFYLTQTEALDGRTLKDKNRVLYRIDAIISPAPGQICRDASDEAFDCGEQARFMLERATAGLLTCVRVGKPDQEPIKVRCRDMANRDIGAKLVYAGWALPEPGPLTSAMYAFDAMEAKARRKGLWAGSFDLNLAQR